MMKLTEIRKSAAYRLTQPFARLLAKTPVTPDALTWTGFWLTAIAGIFIIYQNLLIAGIVVIFAGFFDMLDGALARLTQNTTRFGAILDSTLDRVAEAVILLSLLVLYAKDGSTFGILLVGVTLTGSFLVSYVRARVETLGIDCKGGFFTRPERVIVLALGLLFSHIDYVLLAALLVITFFSYITVIQRLAFAWQQTRNAR